MVVLANPIPAIVSMINQQRQVEEDENAAYWRRQREAEEERDKQQCIISVDNSEE